MYATVSCSGGSPTSHHSRNTPPTFANGSTFAQAFVHAVLLHDQEAGTHATTFSPTSEFATILSFYVNMLRGKLGAAFDPLLSACEQTAHVAEITSYASTVRTAPAAHDR